MVITEKKKFQMHEEDVKKIFKELKSHNVYTEKNNDGFKLMIQSSDNTVYDIQIYIIEKFELEEQQFMFTSYPHVKTFEDIQIELFGKIRWK